MFPDFVKLAFELMVSHTNFSSALSIIIWRLKLSPLCLSMRIQRTCSQLRMNMHVNISGRDRWCLLLFC
jgi:hypothetical protein